MFRFRFSKLRFLNCRNLLKNDDDGYEKENRWDKKLLCYAVVVYLDFFVITKYYEYFEN